MTQDGSLRASVEKVGSSHEDLRARERSEANKGFTITTRQESESASRDAEESIQKS